MTVSIDPREKFVWWAVEDGWNKKIGFTCELNDLKCSVVFMKIDSSAFLIISELNSGVALLKIPISIVEAIMCGTKEKTLVMMQEKLEKLSEVLMNEEDITTESIVSETSEKLAEHVKKFGPMPAIEFVEEW